MWRTTVFVTCPGCGIKGSLDHDVDANGKITPSLDCPECSFHTYVVLDGWDHGPVKRQ